MIQINKIFISLTPIGYGGAGDYLHEINKEYLDYTKFITPNFFLKFKLINRIFIKIFSVLLKIFLKIFVRLIKIESLVIFHQQSIGYDLSSQFILRSNNIKLYVLDTNFFCKKSYNEYNNKPCFSCYNNFKPYDDCFHHPRGKENDSDYVNFLKILSIKVKNIQFIVQTTGYKKLIQDKFQTSNVLLKKMLHDKLKFNNDSLDNKIKNFKFDFFYHAHISPAKGVNYFCNLANLMPDKKFFLPNNYNYKKISNNVYLKKINWGKKFIDEINNSKIILCPSVWTYPVESSIIKSMLLKKGVAIIDSKYSFSELIPDNCIIKLTGNLDEDVLILANIIKRNAYTDYGKNGYEWVMKYLKHQL